MAAVDSLLKHELIRIQREVDSLFDALLPIPSDFRVRLVEAMRHATIGGGKRVRPLLLTATGRPSRSSAPRSVSRVNDPNSMRRLLMHAT